MLDSDIQITRYGAPSPPAETGPWTWSDAQLYGDAADAIDDGAGRALSCPDKVLGINYGSTSAPQRPVLSTVRVPGQQVLEFPGTTSGTEDFYLASGQLDTWKNGPYSLCYRITTFVTATNRYGLGVRVAGTTTAANQFSILHNNGGAATAGVNRLGTYASGAAGALTALTWYTLCFLWGGPATPVRVYKDAALVATTAATGAATALTMGQAWVGRWPGVSSNGAIIVGAWAAYSRELNLIEITELHTLWSKYA